VDGKRVLSKHPGSQQYYYIFERITSDKKAMKMIRLNAQQVRRVRDGWYTVEELADKKAAKRSQVFKEKVSYCFCD
jgi:predicted DNA-binding protein